MSLPTVAAYNVRSFFPKVGNFKIDMIERGVSVALVSEIWEKSENKEHIKQIETMLEIDGLKYLSTSRPSTMKGGGAAIIVNVEKFSVEKIEISIPNKLEVVWGLLKPKVGTCKLKNIIVCSFYSPPKSRKNTKLADHLISTLHMLSTKYPESGIILGGDKNSMDISPLLNCGLRLKQVVDKSTINGKILDVLIMNLSKYYNSPIIAPPICPDNPDYGKPSDHSVPICSPHTNPHTQPLRTWKYHTYRPLPDSSVRRLGQWITAETWGELSQCQSATELASKFEQILKINLDKYCPLKKIKVSSQDKPYFNSELKKLHRLKSREYIKKGKTDKYKALKHEFDKKLKIAAQKYLDKNVEELKDIHPGRAYKTLKRMGAQPGDCTDSGSFHLPSHAGYSALESAERIADHFANISGTFPPLSVDQLPSRVQTKLGADTRAPPVISVEETWRKIEKAKKPNSGVPSDLPRAINKEFSVELAQPLTKIINEIVRSAHWPAHWKQEYVTPIGKISKPETEDDLRPISLTPFFSKVTEHFVVGWLLEHIKSHIDFRQYGGMKGNSITHYLIEFINFILFNQENSAPTAILACLVDFSQAFNRQNHNILITKLSDMGVPAWLLKIVMSFLEGRSMVVRHQGATSSPRALPGGGPQGTLLGLLLFIVLINEVGYNDQLNNTGEMITCRKNLKEANRIHLKFVDDLTIAESIPLKESLKPNLNRALPDNYHCRTGHTLIPEKSSVYNELEKIQEYAKSNDMKINLHKTKFMLFNQCKSFDFMPSLELEGCQIDLVEDMKILGVMISSDMKFSKNTQYIIKKAYRRIWMLKRLKNLGATTSQMLDVYTKQVRSVLELAVPAWQPSLTISDKNNLERVQKCALKIIYGHEYQSYTSSCESANLLSLEDRRVKMCKAFALKALKSDKFSKWFNLNRKKNYTRHRAPVFQPVVSRTTRFEKSPIHYLTRLLNQEFQPS